METTLPFELLRSAWLIREDALDMYRTVAASYFNAIVEGRQEIAQGFFSKLAAPPVPNNVALIVMNGALTKADICGGKGSRTLTAEILAAASNSKYDAILLYAENCPGGQVDGSKTMADAVNLAKAKKPVVGAFSGMSCSGGAWIQSQCTEWWATSETDMVGCIGVMATLRNPKTKLETEDLVVYSDFSPKKNEESRDPNLLKAHYLNPVAKLFHADVTGGRGGKLLLEKEDVLSGATYIAGDATNYGLIDGVMPINKIIARSLFLARTKKNQK